MLTIFTSFNKDYGSRALLLAESIRKSCSGDYSIVALVVDHLNKREENLFLSMFDEIIYADQLLSFSENIFDSHTVVEACTLFKPFAMRELLKRDSKYVMYLDPDTMVVSNIVEYIEKLSGRFSIHLTPHICDPVPGVLMNVAESSVLKHGVYNLGYVCVLNDKIGRNFANWWGRRILFSCVDDLGTGHFTDQKIVDLCPALFQNVYIDRNYGLNVAPWNLHERRIEFRESGLHANNDLILFFHFSKIGHVGAGEILRACSDEGGALEIALFYKHLLENWSKSAVLSGLRAGWDFNRNAAGEVLTPSMREINKRRFKEYVLDRTRDWET